MIAKTLQGTITSWNPAAERMYGHTTAEAVGHYVLILCPTSEQEDEVAQILARVASGERIDHLENDATALGRFGDRRVLHGRRRRS